MDSLFVRAPCKINLTLDVFDKNQRTDGYHNLDSLVLPLNEPNDELLIRIQPCVDQTSIKLMCNNPSLPLDSDNLAYRATELYLKSIGKHCDVEIDLRKAIPTEAGLGGGSSDAAAVLRALNEYFKKTLEPSALQEMASLLGGDVSLFLAEQPVRMRGFGDIIEYLDFDFPHIWGVIVHPQANVSTPRAYRLLDAIPNRICGDSTERLLTIFRKEDTCSSNISMKIANVLSNDFESAILPEYPNIAKAFTLINDLGALRAILCGSGSAVFGLASDKDHAMNLASKLTEYFSQVICVTNASKELFQIKRL